MLQESRRLSFVNIFSAFYGNTHSNIYEDLKNKVIITKVDSFLYNKEKKTTNQTSKKPQTQNYGTFNPQSDCIGYKLKFKPLLQMKSKTKSKWVLH